MKLINKTGYIIAIILVLLACFTEDTEARRRVLRGRRTITRTYSRGLSIPAWAIIVITGICEILVGLGIYFGMRKWVLSSARTNEPGNTYRAALQDDV